MSTTNRLQRFAQPSARLVDMDVILPLPPTPRLMTPALYTVRSPCSLLLAMRAESQEPSAPPHCARCRTTDDRRPVASCTLEGHTLSYMNDNKVVCLTMLTPLHRLKQPTHGMSSQPDTWTCCWLGGRKYLHTELTSMGTIGAWSC